MKISIIIPVYNKIKYLRTLLNQIKNQSFMDYECLLVDDGSTDGSGIICDEFSYIDSRFKVLHISNGGVSNARNIGLDNASGEYITFIDADDEILPMYIENLYNCIYKSEADIVISGYEKFWDTNDNNIKISHPYKKGFYKLDDCIDDFAEVQNATGLFGCCVSKIFKKDLCQNIYFDNNIFLAEDFDFYLKIYSRAKSLFFDDQHLYLYRQEALNSSALIADENIDYITQVYINLRYKEFLIDKNAYNGKNKSLVDNRIANYLYFSLFYCHKDKMDLCLTEIKKIQEKDSVKAIYGDFFQKVILAMLKYKLYKFAKVSILLYKQVRSIIRGK